MPRDLAAVLISAVYVGLVVGVSEALRRALGRTDEFTRKFVHVGVGLWIVPTFFLYETWYWAALLPAAAVVGNFASLRLNLLKSIERGDRHDYGTVLFPVSFVICIALFFNTDYEGAAAAGILMMALGDAAAAIVGVRFGRRAYTFLGAKKSVEGSAAMLVVSFAAAFAALLIFGAPAAVAAITALILAVAGTFLEAAGKHGLDNLTVPVGCAGLAFLMLRALEGAFA